jgi:REP element-mobilizing transposase RayT
MFHIIIKSFGFLKPTDPSLAQMCCENLIQCHQQSRLTIRAFSLMPDHLHLCAEPGKEDLDGFIAQWKSFTTHQAWKTGWKGKLWQPRNRSEKVVGEDTQTKVIDYILQNPVRANITAHWRDYPWWAQPLFEQYGWTKGPSLVPSPNKNSL